MDSFESPQIDIVSIRNVAGNLDNGNLDNENLDFYLEIKNPVKKARPFY